MPTPRTTLAPLTFPAIALAGPDVPPALQQALIEFGLTTSFKQRASSLQHEYVNTVASAHSAEKAARIAEVLDELAQTEPLYRFERSL